MHREYKDKTGWMHYTQSGETENIKVSNADGDSVEGLIWEESVTTGKQRVHTGFRTLVQFKGEIHASTVSHSKLSALKDLAQQLGKNGDHLNVWGTNQDFQETGLSQGSGYGYFAFPDGKTTPPVRGIAARLSQEELEAAAAKKAADLEEATRARKDRETHTRNQLLYLARCLSRPKLNRTLEFGGANVVFTETLPEIQTAKFYSPPKYVVTEYAREISWFIFSLRDIFYKAKLINFSSKFEFFGRLGNSANRCLMQSPTTGAHGVCAAVVHEAFAIFEEIQAGNFRTLLFAIDDEIFDDRVDQSERKGFISLENTYAFFKRLGVEVIQDRSGM